MPDPPPDPPPDPDLDERGREAVARRERGEGNRTIMAQMKVSGTWLQRTFRKAGLPYRLSTGQAIAPPVPIGDPQADELPIGRRLERLLANRIGDIEMRVRAGRSLDPERIARALATNARTLVDLGRAKATEIHDPAETLDTPSRSLAELRDELARHLERVRVAERARRGLDGAGPDRG